MINMPPKLGDLRWLNQPGLQRLMGVLNSDGARARIVGGSVRDVLINQYWNKNRKIGDIDIASTLSPEENITSLEAAEIKVIPTGIKHGTVTAIMGDKYFEITTLRRDVKTDGRHAEVEYTDDWTEDAKRRDFTINALYLAMDGSVYDPLGGLDDLKAAKVRFIGDARERIKEDALRILRFFRFSSDIEVGGINERGMLACVELKELISGLSGERIWQEFSKILLSRRAIQVLPAMAGIGILREILPDYDDYHPLLGFIHLQKKLRLRDDIGRLSCLLPRDEPAIRQSAKWLRLSNAQRDQLIRFARDYPVHDLKSKTLRRVIYQRGKDVVIHNLTLQGMLDAKTLYYINDYKIPDFPYKGADLIAEGWKAGKELGEELKRLEAEWVENDFKVVD